MLSDHILNAVTGSNIQTRRVRPDDLAEIIATYFVKTARNREDLDNLRRTLNGRVFITCELDSPDKKAHLHIGTARGIGGRTVWVKDYHSEIVWESHMLSIAPLRSQVERYIATYGSINAINKETQTPVNKEVQTPVNKEVQDPVAQEEQIPVQAAATAEHADTWNSAGNIHTADTPYYPQGNAAAKNPARLAYVPLILAVLGIILKWYQRFRFHFSIPIYSNLSLSQVLHSIVIPEIITSQVITLILVIAFIYISKTGKWKSPIANITLAVSVVKICVFVFNTIYVQTIYSITEITENAYFATSLYRIFGYIEYDSFSWIISYFHDSDLDWAFNPKRLFALFIPDTAAQLLSIVIPLGIIITKIIKNKAGKKHI